MRLNNLKDLEKLKRKNIGNVQLVKAIDQLVIDLIDHSFKSHDDLKKVRPDADRIHPEDFYFFDINIDRTMIMMKFEADTAKVVWVGSHDDYERAFKNNKFVIEKWLKDKDLIK